jgi:hypothetical protein
VKEKVIFSSALHLFVILIMLSFSFVLMAIPYSEQLLLIIKNSLENNPFIFFQIGIFLFIFTSILFLSFFFLYRKNFIKIKMQKNKIDVDLKIISKYIEDYLKQKYKNSFLSSDINLNINKKLEIIASFSSINDQNKESLLEIENNIGKILFDQLNYDKDFVFTINSN